MTQPLWGRRLGCLTAEIAAQDHRRFALLKPAIPIGRSGSNLYFMRATLTERASNPNGRVVPRYSAQPRTPLGAIPRLSALRAESGRSLAHLVATFVDDDFARTVTDELGAIQILLRDYAYPVTQSFWNEKCLNRSNRYIAEAPLGRG